MSLVHYERKISAFLRDLELVGGPPEELVGALDHAISELTAWRERVAEPAPEPVAEGWEPSATFPEAGTEPSEPQDTEPEPTLA